MAVLDDRLARNCAGSLGLAFKGTIGLFLWLKRSGKLPAVKPYLDKIAETDFRLDESLRQEALALAGE